MPHSELPAPHTVPEEAPSSARAEPFFEPLQSGGGEAERKAAWEAGGELMRRIYARGASEVLAPIANLRQAFAAGKERITCIDAGVVMAGSGRKGLALAGSGILFPAGSWEERLDRVADLCLALGVRETTSHEGCGAAALAYERDGRPAEHPTSDLYGQAWSRSLQERIGRRCERPAGYRHIAAGEMARPMAFHDCRVTWLDCTGQFIPGNLSGQLPQGYLVDRWNVIRHAASAAERSYPWVELAISIELALAASGFGERFTPEEPFLVVAVTGGEEDWAALRAELEDVVARHGGRVRIDRLRVSPAVARAAASARRSAE